MRLLVAGSFRDARIYLDSLPPGEQDDILVVGDSRSVRGIERGTECLVHWTFDRLPPSERKYLEEVILPRFRVVRLREEDLDSELPLLSVSLLGHSYTCHWVRGPLRALCGHCLREAVYLAETGLNTDCPGCGAVLEEPEQQ